MKFRIGDRVMQLRNNYDKDVYNGDIGFIHDLNEQDRSLVVLFDGILGIAGINNCDGSFVADHLVLAFIQQVTGDDLVLLLLHQQVLGSVDFGFITGVQGITQMLQAEAEGIAVVSREQAEGEFRRNILPSLMDTPKHLMITADVAMKSPVRPLQWLVRDALEAERRAPYAMCYALRGAFHHRKMNFFRANDSRGPEFVIGIELKPFDVEHAIPELAEIARFIEANPCCDKNELPGGEEAFKHLQWLVSTGHAVAFTNGVYSAVEKFPKYGPQWKKRPAKMQDIPAPAESAEIGTASAAPEPAESAEVKETSEVKEEEKNETAAQLAE
jgi:hypothetical protein